MSYCYVPKQQGCRRSRGLLLTRNVYKDMCKLLNAPERIPVANRTSYIQLLFRKISLYQLSLERVHDPYVHQVRARIVRDGLIVLPLHEVDECIKWHYVKSKGDCARKLQYRIGKTYYGIGKGTIQRWINKQPQCSKRKPLFDNRAPLRPINADAVNSRHQIDIVDMSRCPDYCNGKMYKYVLSVLDVFSRLVWLRALPSRKAEAVVQAVSLIYNEWSYPKVIQTDQGQEFKGAFAKFCEEENIRLIHSRSHHPQSQGKDERSHQTWKNKIRFDMQHCKDVKWAKNLSTYQFIYNQGYHSSIGMTPHECYFGNTSTVSNKAQRISTKAANSMVERSLSKHPPSQYNVGEKVLVRFPRKPSRGVIRGGNSLRHTSCCEGKVIAVDRRRFRYQIQVQQSETGDKARWFSVSDVTSLTREKENRRRQQSLNKREAKKTRYVNGFHAVAH